MELSAAVIALVGTLFGGAGFKVLEHFLTKRQVVDTRDSGIRTELRADIDRRDEELIRKEDQIKYYRDELSKGEDAHDELRDKYYKLMDENLELKRQNTIMKEQEGK